MQRNTAVECQVSYISSIDATRCNPDNLTKFVNDRSTAVSFNDGLGNAKITLPIKDAMPGDMAWVYLTACSFSVIWISNNLDRCANTAIFEVQAATTRCEKRVPIWVIATQDRNVLFLVAVD